jgi:hypothetical protein
MSTCPRFTEPKKRTHPGRQDPRNYIRSPDYLLRAPFCFQNIDLNVRGVFIRGSCTAVLVQGEDDEDPSVSVGQGPTENVFPAP